MANITVSNDIDTLLQSANNAAAKSNLGILEAYNYIGPTEPTSPADGFRWLETATEGDPTGATESWQWNDTASLWLSTHEFLANSSDSVPSSVEYGPAAPNIFGSNINGIFVTNILGAWRLASGTVFSNSANFYRAVVTVKSSDPDQSFTVDTSALTASSTANYSALKTINTACTPLAALTTSEVNFIFKNNLTTGSPSGITRCLLTANYRLIRG